MRGPACFFKVNFLPCLRVSVPIQGVILCATVASFIAFSASPSRAEPPDPAASISGAPEAVQPPVLTILTDPPDSYLSLRGESSISGRTPLDLPLLWTGRFSVRVEGEGISAAQGVLYLPSRGGPVKSLSEPDGFSAQLLVRSLNYPGIPTFSSERRWRGALFGAAATAAVVAGIHSHVEYRDLISNPDLHSVDRGEDYQRGRNAWAVYFGAVYGLSAIDYWVRSRVDLVESTPSRITLSAPAVSRGGAVWRSFLVPGAGQEYSNRGGTGLFWLAATLAAGGSYVTADGIVSKYESDLSRAERAASVASPSDLALLTREISRKNSDIESMKDVRRGTLAAAAILHVLNVFDAALVPAGAHAVGSPPKKVSLSFPLLGQGSSIAVSTRF